MIKRIFTYGLCLILLSVATVAVAKTEYIYRKRVNWVKIKKADAKEVPLGGLRQPFIDITVDQMEAMLLSIKIARRYLFKKDLKTVDVFNSWEARKFAPYLVEALAKVSPDQVVHFSVVNKRPKFLLRNDRLTMGNLWVADDGIHFQFSKLFAKLVGDYEASAQMDKLIRKAKTMRVSLEANAGQTLSYESPMEIIIDPKYNFVEQRMQEEQQEQLAEQQFMQGSSQATQPAQQAATSQPESAPAAYSSSQPSSQQGSVATRLRQLDSLKKQKLITEKEYQTYRKKILSEI